MSWKLRHEGSPIAVEDLTLQQVVDGLQDGRWEATDEVMGPDEAQWSAIENHPQLAEIAEELQPRPPRTYDDETRLDFTALIDVTLVLLIFFILTTSYAALQKLIDAPTVTMDKETGVPTVTKDQVKEFMIHVKVTMERNQPVVRVEGQVVEEEALLPAFLGFTRGVKRKNELLIECDPDVPRQTVVAIQDKATGAKVQRIYRLVPTPAR